MPNPLAGYITDPNSVLSSPTVQQFQLNLPCPQFTSVWSDVPPIADSMYNGLQITAQKNYSNGPQFLWTYVWSKSIDDASLDDDNVTWMGSFLSLQDPNKPWLERSLSIFDIPQVFQASYVYALPFGRGKPFLNGISRVHSKANVSVRIWPCRQTPPSGRRWFCERDDRSWHGGWFSEAGLSHSRGEATHRRGDACTGRIDRARGA
ncbi:MAG: hypothetical protein ACLQMO_16540 [Acidobacteriaceae bacterium]